jgi:hypothetical protein
MKCYDWAEKETEVEKTLERIIGLKLANIDLLLQNLSQIEKYIESDRIFANMFFAKGGKRVLVDYIRDGNKLTDTKKWLLEKKISDF